MEAPSHIISYTINANSDRQNFNASLPPVPSGASGWEIEVLISFKSEGLLGLAGSTSTAFMAALGHVTVGSDGIYFNSGEVNPILSPRTVSTKASHLSEAYAEPGEELNVRTVVRSTTALLAPNIPIKGVWTLTINAAPLNLASTD